jgi:hypothetical protein
VPTVSRPDGVELHWEERGEGPLVVVAAYWSMHPSTFDPLIGELVRMIRKELPGAHLERVDDGFVSRPEQTAAVVRRISARAPATA